jgi:hypothetical protein
MPVPKQVVRMVLAGLTCGALVTTGACGLANGDDGPTAAEAGTQLAKDARSLLDQVQDIHNLTQPYSVTEDASNDVSCGQGKAKRAFVATTQVPAEGNLDNRLDRETTRAIGGLPMAYKVTDRSNVDDLSGRRVVMRNEDLAVTVTVRLTPTGSNVTYDVRGETDCLSTK